MRAAILAISSLLLLFGCAADKPNPPLPTSTIAIDTARGPHTFQLEMAESSQQQESGLMFRKSMAPDAGMLFDFHQTVMAAFWMKNTLIPLDLLFVRPDGTISTIAADAVPMSTAEIRSAEPIRAVIEINGGRAAALGIVPGCRVHSDIFAPAPKPGH
jgi:uncharacterized protein